MTDERCLEQRLQELGDAISPGPTFTESVMTRVASKPMAPITLPLRTTLAAAVLKPRRMVLAACAVALAVSLFPFGDPADVGNADWWLAPKSVWAAEMQANIEKASLKGYSCQEHVTFLTIGSNPNTSSKLFVSDKRQRRDGYAGDRLRETQWYVHGDEGLMLTSVNYLDKTYTVNLDPKSKQTDDAMTTLKGYLQSLFKSGKRVGAERVEGRDAIVFSVEPSKTDAQNGQGATTIWFDQATKMPLKMLATSGIVVYMQSQYDWNPRLPANTFEPVIPAGFTKIDNK